MSADTRIFQCSSLKVDNSSLTGDSEALERTSAEATQENALEAINLLLSGTFIAAGEGFSIVIRTGDATVFFQLACITSNQADQQSPLSIEISRFVKRMGTFAIATGVALFVYGLATGNSVNTTLIFAVRIIAAFVPEGLPTTVSFLLAIVVKQMVAQNKLVKDLHAIETLGSVICVASDKTGKLTQNRMTVTHVWLSGSSRILYFRSTVPPPHETAKEDSDRGGKASVPFCGGGDKLLPQKEPAVGPCRCNVLARASRNRWI